MQSTLRVVLAAVVGVFALLVLLERFVLVELLVRRIGLPLLVALVTAAAAIACGVLARRSRSVDVPLDLIVGLPIFGTLCFLVGLLSVTRWTMVGTAVVAIVAAAMRIRSEGGLQSAVAGLQSGNREGELHPANRNREPVAAGLKSALRERPLPLLAVALALACGFVMAQAPPISLDELAYHLAVPRTWAHEGRAVELPLNSHSYFPLGVESASLPAMTLLDGIRAGIAARLLHLLAAVATVVLLLRRTDSWLATAAIVATPALAVTAGWSLVEWPLVGLAVVMTGALRDDDDATAAAATAAGLLTKYTFAPLAVIAFLLARKWRPGVVGAIAGSVFFLRNLILTGNPVAPFFSSDAPHVSGFRALDLTGFIFEGRFIDEAVGGSILALAAGASGALGLAALALAILLFLLGPSARILLPYLTVAGISATSLLERSRLMRGLVALLIVVQLFFVTWYTAESGAFGLLAARYSDDDYLKSQRPSMQTIEWLNATLPPGSRTLVVGIGETYWFAHRVRGGGNFDGARISRYVALPNSDALRERLRRDGITHVAVLTPRVPTVEATKRAERTTGLTPDAQRTLAQMLNREAASIATRGEDALFTLK